MFTRKTAATVTAPRAAVVEPLEERRLMAGQRIFYEGFESGAPNWSVDTELSVDQGKAWGVRNGFARSGNRSAGTINPGFDAILASPAINLPGVNQYNEHLYLRWWQHADYASRGGMAASSPVVREWVPALSSWGPWNVIDPNTETTPQTTKTWGYVGLDLTQFAGQRVQVGFHHYGSANGASGWSVDDVEITRESIQRWNADTSFESGFQGWTTTRGMWNVGTPSGTGVPSGSKVASTGLTGAPPAVFNSSLVSPAFYLPAGGGPVTLEFKSFADRPFGTVMTVEFQFWMPSRGWSPVNNISADVADTVLNGQQPGGRWTTFRIPLTNSLNSASFLPHRLLFTATSGIDGARGWTIDDVKLNFPGKGAQQTPTPTPTPAPAPRRPEIRVNNQFGELTDNVTRVNWGSHRANSGNKDLVFTVRNAGTANLTLGGIVLNKNAGFTVVRQPAKTVAPGATTTFTLRMLTGSAGNKSAAVRFVTNDADENPFDFNIAGVVTR